MTAIALPRPGAPMFADIRFRIGTYLLMRREIGITPRVDEFSALTLLCRQLRSMGGNRYDAAIGFVIARNLAAEPERMRSASDKAALKVTRDQVKKYLKRPQARAKR